MRRGFMRVVSFALLLTAIIGLGTILTIKQRVDLTVPTSSVPPASLIEPPRVELLEKAQSVVLAQATRSAELPAICSGDMSNFGCYDRYFGGLVRDKGITAAFVDLKDQYQTSQYVRNQCHQLTHVIGRYAVTKFPTVGEAYKEGDSFCWSGYYHGVLEGFAERIGKQNIVNEMDHLCDSVSGKAEKTFNYYNCVHGLGHGIMSLLRDELFESLTYCDQLTGAWEQLSCSQGVFMENIISDISGHRTNYLRPEEPFYPCNEAPEKYKNTCYSAQTSYALQTVHRDFSKLFDLCTGVEGGYREVCYAGVGRDASGQALSKLEPTRSWCMLGKNETQRKFCIVGAVKDFISYFHSDVQARELCAAIDAENLRSVCLETVVEYYANFR